MEISINKNYSLVFKDNKGILGFNSDSSLDGIVNVSIHSFNTSTKLFPNKRIDEVKEDSLYIYSAGEYEKSEIIIRGISFESEIENKKAYFINYFVTFSNSMSGLFLSPINTKKTIDALLLKNEKVDILVAPLFDGYNLSNYITNLAAKLDAKLLIIYGDDKKQFDNIKKSFSNFEEISKKVNVKTKDLPGAIRVLKLNCK